MYSTRQIVQREKHGFCLFQNICKSSISISSFYRWCYIIYCSNTALPWILNFISANLKFSKDQNWSSRCNEFVFQKVYLSKYVFWILPSIWSVLLEYLHHFYVAIFYGVLFMRYLFLFIFVFGFAVVVFFSFDFISGQNFRSSS